MAEQSITKETVTEVGAGTIAISIDSTSRSPSVIIKNTGVTITANNPSFGISVDDGGVSVQGKLALSSSGKNITKGIYSENDKSGKPFTYEETISLIGVAEEEIYTQLSKQIGSDITIEALRSGRGTIITDVAGGPKAHVHSISMKHVHSLEPAYLYRLPPLLTGMKGMMDQFKQFLGA